MILHDPACKSDRHAGDLCFEDELPANDALRLRDESTWRRFDLFDEDDELISRNDLSTEARVIAAQESEETERGEARSEEPTRALRGGLDHQNAGVERASLDVMLTPKFVRPNVLDADTFAKVLARPHDAIALPHWSGLREVFVESSAVANRLGEIDRGEVNQMFTCHGSWAELLRAVLAAAHFKHLRADLLGDVLDVLHRLANAGARGLVAANRLLHVILDLADLGAELLVQFHESSPGER